MRKLNKILAVLLSATMLFGCSNSGEKPNEKDNGIAKVGFGMVANKNDEKGQVNTTMCTLALDADGKIVSVYFDVAQHTFGANDEVRTKREKKEDYNMKGASGLGKEWYEQVQDMEAFFVGKTVDEIKGYEYVEANGHTDVAAEGSDLAAVCTMSMTDFLAALVEANTNAEAVTGAEKVVVGETNTVKDNEVDTTVTALALDKDGKIVWANVDVQQTKPDTTEFRSKLEKKEDYNMKGASPIGKEWYEQAAGLEEYLVGKTLADVKAIELGEANGHTDVPVEGSDLAAVCTISLTDVMSALEEALGR